MKLFVFISAVIVFSQLVVPNVALSTRSRLSKLIHKHKDHNEKLSLSHLWPFAGVPTITYCNTTSTPFIINRYELFIISFRIFVGLTAICIINYNIDSFTYLYNYAFIVLHYHQMTLNQTKQLMQH